MNEKKKTCEDWKVSRSTLVKIYNATFSGDMYSSEKRSFKT